MKRPRLLTSWAVALGFLVQGCATAPLLSVPASTPVGRNASLVVRGPAPSGGAGAGSAAIEALVDDSPVTVAFPPQPLPQFIDAALAGVLGLAYGLGPGVSDRTALVTFNSGGAVSRRALLRMVRTVLRQHGLDLRLQNGVLIVVEAAGPATDVLARLDRRPASSPPSEIALPKTFQLQALAALDVERLVGKILPEGSTIRVQADAASNSLSAVGPAAEIAQLADIVQRLDRPAFAGARVAEIAPTALSPTAFASALEAAAAAGVEASGGATAAPLLILPLVSGGEVLVFLDESTDLSVVRGWAALADRASIAAGPNTFVYRARNLEAQALGSLISTAVATPRSEQRVPTGVPGAPPSGAEALAAANPGAPAGAVTTGGAVVVDTIGNRLVFTGTAAEYARLRQLLEQLDVPPGQVMIEVTIAEVTLTDATRAGLEWFFSQSESKGVLSGGTLGGLGLQTGGLNLKFDGPDLRVAFNAFASNNNVNILSRPRLVARSGGEAQIQVGADVPIITSQTAASVQSNGDTDVLQTVQYRQTGVILRIKPVVFAGDRVDLEISQEVSSQQPNNNSAIGSPLFLNRSASTKISLVDGATAVIGGLMDDSVSHVNSGVPFLKDVPILGAAFRSDALDGHKTELVLLVTPFIVHDFKDLSAAAKEMAIHANQSFADGLRVYTLTPWRRVSAHHAPGPNPPD